MGALRLTFTGYACTRHSVANTSKGTEWKTLPCDCERSYYTVYLMLNRRKRLHLIVNARGFTKRFALIFFLLHRFLYDIAAFTTSRTFVVIIIKSPRYTGGDFMFLYRFVRRRRRRRRRRRPQILVHAITFEQPFGFLSFLAQLLALTCRLPD